MTAPIHFGGPKTEVVLTVNAGHNAKGSGDMPKTFECACLKAKKGCPKTAKFSYGQKRKAHAIPYM